MNAKKLLSLWGLKWNPFSPELPSDALLMTEAAAREELCELLSHALAKAGNATLMTAPLMDALVDHCAGNYRLLMTMGGELLAHGMAREVAQLDEKFYLELFHPQRATPKKKARV